MTPLETYRQACLRSDFIADAAQERAAQALDDLHKRLVSAWENHRAHRFHLKAPDPVIGLYLWGGVGRGKTWLMDAFFAAIPFRRKKRLHFHRFMQEIHHALRDRQGQKNPLESIADEFSRDAKLLCLDEFFVIDIADAMLLGGLLAALFERGVTLVTTSNIEPDGLYMNGLQRQRFLPAIEQLKRHTQVLNVDGGVDYRLRSQEMTERYLCPLDDRADAFMEQWVQQLAGDEVLQRKTSIELEGRKVAVRVLGEHLAWFDFRTLCDGPRSQNDYIALAKRFDTILLSNVERMNAMLDDVARRFVNLVDEFYDAGVKLIVTSEVPIAELYSSGHLEFEFQRTESRLQEMQTQEYMAQSRRD
jgi:cell division protein ZapE